MGAQNGFVFMVVPLIGTKICASFWSLDKQMAFHCLLFMWPSNKRGTWAKLFDCFCRALHSYEASLVEAEAPVPAGTKRLITGSATLLMTEPMFCRASSLKQRGKVALLKVLSLIPHIVVQAVYIYVSGESGNVALPILSPAETKPLKINVRKISV